MKDNEKWPSGWLSIAIVFAATELIVNAFYGRFPLFLIKTGNPAIAIPLGSLFEVIGCIAVFLILGGVIELVRRIFRAPLSCHLGAEVASIICLVTYLLRTLIAVCIREHVYRNSLPPEFDDRWLMRGVFLLAIVVGIAVACWRRRSPLQIRPGDERRLTIFAFSVSAIYVITFNIWMNKPVIRFLPVLLGVGLVVLGSIFFGLFAATRGWTGFKIAKWTAFAALIAVIALTTYYAWPSQDQRPHVIVPLWDAARASRMSLYGYDESTTPGLESLSPRALIFDGAYSPSNYTYPSHATFFVGKSYRAHNYHFGAGEDYKRYQSEFTLPDQLNKSGYQTALFSENSWVLALDKGYDYARFFPILSSAADPRRKNCEFSEPPSFYNYSSPFLFRQLIDYLTYKLDGFYSFTIENFQFRCAQELFLRWRRKGPVFLFWNWMNAHQRYYPNDRWVPGTEVNDYDFAGEYTSGLKYADQRFMKLYKLVEYWGQGGRTIFMVVSDHGEFLGEYNIFGHNKALFEPVLRVPLILIHPELEPRRVLKPVSLTAFRSLVEGLAAGSVALTSDELASLMTGEKTVIAEHGYLPDEDSTQYEWCYTVLDQDIQYIYDPLIGTYNCSWPPDKIDLLLEAQSDPRQKNNRYNTEPERVLELKEFYSDYLRKLEEEGRRVAPPGAKVAHEQKLRDLGYLD